MHWQELEIHLQNLSSILTFLNVRIWRVEQPKDGVVRDVSKSTAKDLKDPQRKMQDGKSIVSGECQLEH